jgi:hypothetical protein
VGAVRSATEAQLRSLEAEKAQVRGGCGRGGGGGGGGQRGR